MKRHALAIAFAAISASSLSYAQSGPPNPFARPAAKAPQPAIATPAVPSAVMAPPPMGLPPVVPPRPADDEFSESVTGTRIGEVNGMHIYRGTVAGAGSDNTYLFEPRATHKVKRSLSRPQSPMGLETTGTYLAPDNSGTSHLPSMVGRPTPSNK